MSHGDVISVVGLFVRGVLDSGLDCIAGFVMSLYSIRVVLISHTGGLLRYVTNDNYKGKVGANVSSLS